MDNQNPAGRLLETRNGLSFLECVEVCVHEPEFVSQWQRLTGKKLIATNPLDLLIDQATGYDLAVMGEFAEFVYTHVFRIF